MSAHTDDLVSVRKSRLTGPCSDSDQSACQAVCLGLTCYPCIIEILQLLTFPSPSRIRELTTARIGSLLRISGQVVRTHPVHPELVSGTFLCLDCQSVIKEVEQQFRYTQPNICKNPVCANRKRFMLDPNKSRFVDFQKVRAHHMVHCNCHRLGMCLFPTMIFRPLLCS